MADPAQNTVGIKLQVTGAQAMAAQFAQVTKGVEKFQSSLQAIGTALAGVGAAFFSFQALSTFFKAAQDSAVATAQLEQALHSTGQEAAASTQEFTDLADELQNLTGVSDEVIQDVSRLLLELTRSADLAKQFTPVVLDMAAAMGIDATSAARLLGNALAGETISIRGFKIQASNATELLEKLTAATHGQAEAAMRAKGPVEALRVQFDEFEETLGKFLITATGDFFKNVAEGLRRLNAELKAFKTDHAVFLAFMNDVGGAVGKGASDNIGKIALAVGALGAVFAGATLAAGIAAFVALVGGATATVIGVTTLAVVALGAAIAGLFAVFNRQAIAEWIGDLKILGSTIQEWLVRGILEAQLAWLEFQQILGRDVTDDIAIITRKISDLAVAMEQAKKARLAPVATTTGAVGQEAMASQKEMLELKRDQLEVEIRLTKDDALRLNLLERRLQITKELESLKLAEVGQIPPEGPLTEKQLKAAKEVQALEKERKEDEAAITNELEKQAALTFAGATNQRFKEFQRARAIEQSQGLGGFGAGAIAGVKESMVQLGTTAQQVGAAMSSAIGGAVNGIAAGIEGLIKGTLTWHQAIVQVGEAILDSIVKAIAEMIAKMFVSFALQLIFGPIIAAEAATLAKAWAAPAYLASVATEGTAAGVGAAALSSGLATTAALGTFETGGYTGTGPRGQPAGIVHRGEYVVPADTVSRMGLGRLEKTLSSFGNEGGGPAASGGRALNQNLNIFIDRKAWLAANRDDIEAIAINAMARTGWRVNA